jgi:hypothetical protein
LRKNKKITANSAEKLVGHQRRPTMVLTAISEGLGLEPVKNKKQLRSKRATKGWWVSLSSSLGMFADDEEEHDLLGDQVVEGGSGGGGGREDGFEEIDEYHDYVGDKQSEKDTNNNKNNKKKNASASSSKDNKKENMKGGGGRARSTSLTRREFTGGGGDKPPKHEDMLHHRMREGFVDDVEREVTTALLAARANVSVFYISYVVSISILHILHIYICVLLTNYMMKTCYVLLFLFQCREL